MGLKPKRIFALDGKEWAICILYTYMYTIYIYVYHIPICIPYIYMYSVYLNVYCIPICIPYTYIPIGRWHSERSRPTKISLTVLAPKRAAMFSALISFLAKTHFDV